MTPDRLAEIAAERAAITSGRWSVRDGATMAAAPAAVQKLYFVEAPNHDLTLPYGIEILGEDDTGYSTRRNDVRFVANAPQHIDDLITALEAAQGRIATLEAQRDALYVADRGLLAALELAQERIATLEAQLDALRDLNTARRIAAATPSQRCNDAYNAARRHAEKIGAL